MGTGVAQRHGRGKLAEGMELWKSEAVRRRGGKGSTVLCSEAVATRGAEVDAGGRDEAWSRWTT